MLAVTISGGIKITGLKNRNQVMTTRQCGSHKVRATCMPTVDLTQKNMTHPPLTKCR